MIPERQMTQLEKIRSKNTIRVAIVGEKAYWVHENVFYESNVVDGRVDNSAARPIDAHRLSPKQLNELLEILDEIQR